MLILNTLNLLRHSINVSMLSYKIARKLKLEKIQCMRLLFAGLLHDIGKFKLNQRILNKKSKLTNVEFGHIKQHVLLGVELLRKYNVSQSIYEIVEQHHESENGTGYPKGLRGDSISVEAKILRMADIYDALTSNRLYRKKYTKKEALEIMKKENVYGPTSGLGEKFRNINDILD